MTDVVLVDWLGRGGIAQTTDAWGRVIADHGQRASVITRAGLELTPSGAAVPPPRLGGRYAWHAAVVARALRFIAAERPAVVVLQNYVVPELERTIVEHARRRGTRTILVMHNRRPHQRGTGMTIGLDRLIAAADVVVAHSQHVATDLPRTDVRTMPLPRPDILLESTSWQSIDRVVPPVALQFGVMGRGYKGADLLSDLAASPRNDLLYRLCGAGASSSVLHPTPERLQVRDEFLDAAALIAEVRRASIVVLPYRAASQSAAVVLAKALGRTVLASAVGGISEQIDDGVDGFLLPPQAPIETWTDCIQAALGADLVAIGRCAQLSVDAAHEEFRRQVLDLVVGDARGRRGASDPG